MEDLREKVYECTLAVEAHMICDLLARAGVSARVDGEFLAGAGGEMPLGSAVKVRVDPSRAAEAREIIDEWERAQPPPEPDARKASPLRSPLWFLTGAIAGSALMFFALRGPQTVNGVDYDGDENNDVRFHYSGNSPTSTEYDRDGDGKVDARWTFDLRGFEKEFSSDDDFDGRFEWQSAVERGWPSVSRLDVDGDGRTDQTWRFTNSVLSTIEYHRADDGRIVKRENYVAGLLSSADLDVDGDGTFDRQVEYDRFGEPK